MERLHLNFVAKLGNVEKQSIKITNVGSSAIYVEWIFLNTSKINPSALKDSKSKFFSHYETNVIKPGEEISFIFGFLS